MKGGCYELRLSFKTNDVNLTNNCHQTLKRLTKSETYNEAESKIWKALYKVKKDIKSTKIPKFGNFWKIPHHDV